jgi:hypothetical protein
VKLLRGLLFAALNAALYATHCLQVREFRRRVGYFPNIALPRRYHEKMLWRKIFDRNPLFVTFCDKLATKDYVRQRLPALRIPRTLWTGTRIKDAPAEAFRAPVVVKANHGCTFNHFTGGGMPDMARLGPRTRQWLASHHGRATWEWGYFAVPRRLFVEERIAGRGPFGLMDIGVRCADGRAIFAYIFLGPKTAAQKCGAFFSDGAPILFEHDPDALEFLPLPEAFALPRTFARAIACAEALSRGVDYARYDFLTDGEELYAGEITVYPWAGLARASPEGRLGHDTIVNPHWDLRKSWFLGTPQTGWRGLYARLLGRELDGGRA